MTHCRSAAEKPSAVRIAGSAVATIVASSTTTNWARQTTAMPNPGGPVLFLAKAPILETYRCTGDRSTGKRHFSGNPLTHVASGNGVLSYPFDDAVRPHIDALGTTASEVPATWL